jgi:hypothetical protein
MTRAKIPLRPWAAVTRAGRFEDGGRKLAKARFVETLEVAISNQIRVAIVIDHPLS